MIDPPFSSATDAGTDRARRRPPAARRRRRALAHHHVDDVRAADPEIPLIACCGFDVARTRRDRRSWRGSQASRR
jgi:hypothetical protein